MLVSKVKSGLNPDKLEIDFLFLATSDTSVIYSSLKWLP